MSDTARPANLPPDPWHSLSTEDLRMILDEMADLPWAEVVTFFLADGGEIGLFFWSAPHRVESATTIMARLRKKRKELP